MNLRIGYLIIGVFLLFESIYLFMRGNLNFPMLILIFSGAVVNLSLFYLQPQFYQKDERIRIIREKSVFYSYFSLLFYLFVLLLLLYFNIISLTAISTVILIAGLTIITVFLSMVILSFIF